MEENVLMCGYMRSCKQKQVKRFLTYWPLFAKPSLELFLNIFLFPFFKGLPSVMNGE